MHKILLHSHLQDLAELDHDFANRLEQAQERSSDGDIRDLLNAHVHKRQELVEQINAELGGAEPRADKVIEPHYGTGSDIGLHLPALFDMYIMYMTKLKRSVYCVALTGSTAKTHEIIVIAHE